MVKIQNLVTCSIMAGALAACGGGASEEAEGSAASQTAEGDTANAVTGNGSMAQASNEAAAYDPASGPPKAFAQCSICHSAEPGKNMIGPSLAGIYGEKAGDVEGFNFSPAMMKSGLVWDDETLDAYIENPRKVVPGTRMSYAGMKNPEMRQQIIEYIKSL